MKFEVKQENEGEKRWVVTTNDYPDLKCSGRTMIEALTHLPRAITLAEKKKETAMQAEHRHGDHLQSILIKLPEDYEPYGKTDRNTANLETGDWGPDCSYGCKYFYKLEARSKERLYQDWGICGHPDSHRKGLLTFEHQGCPHCVTDLNKRVYGTNPHSTETIEPHEPVQQIPTKKAG